MKRYLVIILFGVTVFGCALNNKISYTDLIESDFSEYQRDRMGEKGKVEVIYTEVEETLGQLIEKSGLVIDPETYDGYEMVNYQINFSGSYWLEVYQVFRLCNKDGCKHKFLLFVGIYA